MDTLSREAAHIPSMIYRLYVCIHRHIYIYIMHSGHQGEATSTNTEYKSALMQSDSGSQWADAIATVGDCEQIHLSSSMFFKLTHPEQSTGRYSAGSSRTCRPYTGGYRVELVDTVRFLGACVTGDGRQSRKTTHACTHARTHTQAHTHGHTHTQEGGRRRKNGLFHVFSLYHPLATRSPL